MNEPALARSFIETDTAPTEQPPTTLSLATPQDREAIYRFRHEVYARELGQHASNTSAILRDSLDERNLYLVATSGNRIAGFVSLTPPGGAYSIDKYVRRDMLPFSCNDWLYEIRLLTVLRPYRGRDLATLLMYAAFRWVEAHGGRRVVAIGRREVVEMYLRSGLESLGSSVRCGAVTYDLLSATVTSLRERINTFGGLLERLENKTVWQLNFPFYKPAACFHGGAFFDAIGPKFDALERNETIINADVLDAWFPPSPGVLDALRQFLPWLLRTSPPTGCQGLIDTIAQARGVESKNILPGAGSSDLIFRALRTWLTPNSHALILDPTYGEYAHVLEKVIGCTTDRLELSYANDYAVNLERLGAAAGDNYDLIILVNPNSPTGRHISRPDLETFLSRVPWRTRVWVDETYIEYAGQNESVEQFAARSENIVVCKSMSKVYALSGARVAYLCAGAHQLEQLRALTPPWVVSLVAQVAGVRALEDPNYYAARYRETAILRETLKEQLERFGLTVSPGIANFLLCRLPDNGMNAPEVVKESRERGLFIRDAAAMGSHLGTRALRIAVKGQETNRRMISILAEVLARTGGF